MREGGQRYWEGIQGMIFFIGWGCIENFFIMIRIISFIDMRTLKLAEKQENLRSLI